MLGASASRESCDAQLQKVQVKESFTKCGVLVYTLACKSMTLIIGTPKCHTIIKKHTGPPKPEAFALNCHFIVHLLLQHANTTSMNPAERYTADTAAGSAALVFLANWKFHEPC